MNRHNRGFTLIEVMVALMVIAIALPALIMALYTQVDATGYMRDKSYARWVASNKLVETRLQVATSGQIFQGRRSGVTEMGDREWYWWLRAGTTEVEDFYRLEIDVAAAEEDENSPLFSLVAFLSAAEVEGAE